MHFIRQEVVSNVSEKENTSKPTSIAPITLVAATSIIKSIAANNTLPKMPNKRTDNTEHKVRQAVEACVKEIAINVTAR